MPAGSHPGGAQGPGLLLSCLDTLTLRHSVWLSTFEPLLPSPASPSPQALLLRVPSPLFPSPSLFISVPSAPHSPSLPLSPSLCPSPAELHTKASAPSVFLSPCELGVTLLPSTPCPGGLLPLPPLLSPSPGCPALRQARGHAGERRGSHTLAQALASNIQGGFYFPCFTHEETEAQRHKETTPAKLWFKPRSARLQSPGALFSPRQAAQTGGLMVQPGFEPPALQAHRD